MTPLQERLAMPLPKRMRTLERDARGYPIPFIVLRDRSGTPQFTINDDRRTSQCISQKLCAICGKRFDMHRDPKVPGAVFLQMWFVGGSRCFLHRHGAFVDPPLHLDCAEYALRVCPFLAAPSYAKRIDDKKLKPGDLAEGMALHRHEHMMPRQPERFGLGCASAYQRVEPSPGSVLFVVARWDYVEWWRNGARCAAPAEACPPDLPYET